VGGGFNDHRIVRLEGASTSSWRISAPGPPAPPLPATTTLGPWVAPLLPLGGECIGVLGGDRGQCRGKLDGEVHTRERRHVGEWVSHAWAPFLCRLGSLLEIDRVAIYGPPLEAFLPVLLYTPFLSISVTGWR
jgi:hypothetical protein